MRIYVCIDLLHALKIAAASSEAIHSVGVASVGVACEPEMIYHSNLQSLLVAIFLERS